MAWPAHRAYVVVDGRPALFVVLLREASPSNVGHRWPGAQGEAGFLVTVVALPARGRPPQAAARRAGLEVVEKLLTSIEVRLCGGSAEA
jgi:membrane-associated PAP2 superfamily phosphatase